MLHNPLRRSSLRALALSLSLALGATVASARVVYVNQNASSPAHDGKSWSTAFPSIQQATYFVAIGDEVWVARGTYDRFAITTPWVALYGGFAGTETARSQRDWKANPTIVSGDGLPDNQNVAFCGAEGIGIDGFTIRNGGTGVQILAAGTPASLSNNVISANEYGVRGWYGNATLVNNVLSSNDQALFFTGGRGTLVNNTVFRNRNGVRFLNATAALINNVVADSGTGVEIWDGKATLTNNIVAFNSDGVFNRDMASISFSHNDVYGNAHNYVLVTDPTGTNGNISVDPLFVDRAAGDFHLKPGSPCIDAGDDSAVPPGITDLDGRLRLVGSHVDMGAYEFATVPHTPLTISLGAPIATAPAISSGVVYAATSDGKLHARSLSDGGAVLSDFPLDLASALGGTVTFNSRLAVYAGKTGPAVYLATRQGHVVKVSPAGKILWDVKPLPGHTNSTPAVTPEGEVLVNLGWEDNPPKAQNFLFSLDETSGRPLSLSPYLGDSTAGSSTDRSPAVYGRLAYINASGETYGGLVALNRSNLTVRSHFAPGEDALSPYVAGGDLYLATKAGHMYKMNAITMNVDLGFGYLGRVALGEKVTAAPFGDASGTLYVGTSSGKVVSIDPHTGARRLFHDSGTGQPVVGLVVERASGVLAYASGDRLIQTPVSDATKAQVQALDGPIVGSLTYDAISDRFVLATAPGSIHAIPCL